MGVVHDTGMQLTRVREKLSLQDLSPGWRGNVTATEDDGGDDRPGTQVEMSAPADVSSSGKISLQDLYPIIENHRCRTYPPPGKET
jgi:hypothetical protein